MYSVLEHCKNSVKLHCIGGTRLFYIFEDETRGLNKLPAACTVIYLKALYCRMDIINNSIMIHSTTIIAFVINEYSYTGW